MRTAVLLLLGTVLTAQDATIPVPANVFSMNASSGAISPWTNSPVGGIDAATLPEPEIIRWKSFDTRISQACCIGRPRASPILVR